MLDPGVIAVRDDDPRESSDAWQAVIMAVPSLPALEAGVIGRAARGVILAVSITPSRQQTTP